MNASISGFLSRGDAERELERILTVFDPGKGRISAQFDRPWPWFDWNVSLEVLDSKHYDLSEVDISPDEKSTVVLRRELTLPWRDFLSEGDVNGFTYEKFCEGPENFTFKKDIALFLPHHNLLVDLKDPYAHDYLRSENPAFKKLGYCKLKSFYDPDPTFHSPVMDTSIAWDDQVLSCFNIDQEDVLYLLRKRKSVHAFDARAQDIVTKLLDNLPFGDELIYSIAVYDIRTRRDVEGYMDEAKEIERKHKKIVEFSGEEIRNGKLEELCNSIPPSFALGIKSGVKYRGEKLHIPMIDFAEDFVPYPDLRYAYKQTMQDELRKLGLNGMLVNSGRSAHFYGFSLLSQGEWGRFMDRLDCLFTPDKKYVEIKKKEGSSTLRFTPALAKPYQPYFVRFFNTDSA